MYRTAIGTGLPYNLDSLKSHIRVNETSDDVAIRYIGETAAAEIEQFAQIALLTQTIRVTIFDPCSESGLTLPIGPVGKGATATIIIDGEVFTAFELVGGHRPYIRWHTAYHDLNPSRITVEYQAGFGVTPDDIPPDLAHALMDQAALHYDGRPPLDAKSLTASPHVARVPARSRGRQL
ncbi:hypothetical protein [Falsihalocynthiibacter sp. CO-5D18]|uniref:head-tail connector protein n=1 Tax=Falsihalocynthiibacter sp. CO-5D18 TaxID=3240872 RepID=UPI0035108D2F